MEVGGLGLVCIVAVVDPTGAALPRLVEYMRLEGRFSGHKRGIGVL